MRITNHLAQGGIGRRLITLFLLAALLPLALLALYSLSKVSAELTGRRQAELVQTSKNYAMGVVERLRRVERLLRDSAEAGTPHQTMTYLRHHLDDELIAAALVVDGRVSYRIGEAAFARPPLAPLRDPELRLLRGNEVLVQYSVPVRLNGGEATIVAVIRDSYLWGTSEDLTNATEIAVLSGKGEHLHQSNLIPPNIVDTLYRHYSVGAHSGTLSVGEGKDEHFAGYWTLPLVTLGGGDFIVAAFQPAAYATGDVESFKRAFIPIALLAALGAALLAVMQIRRLLQPLDALKAAAARVEVNDFSEPLSIRGSKELVALGSAFNSMTQQIGRQLATLNSYAAIDRLVLTSLDVPAVVETALREILALSGVPSVSMLLKNTSDDSVTRYVLNSADGAVTRKRIQGSAVEILIHNRTQPKDGGFVNARLIGDSDQPIGLLELNTPRPFEATEALNRQIDGFLDRVAIACAAARRERLLVLQARYDFLTGLPNRLHFLQTLDAAVERSKLENRGGVLLFLDLDQFKRANDVLGHLAGDAVLKMCAERLKTVIRSGDLLARLGGDEFTLLCGDDPGDAQIEALATDLIDSMGLPFQVEGRSIFVGLSVGIVRFPRDGDNALDLLRRADTAMYHAKKSGGARLAVFKPEMEDEAQGTLALDQALRDGLVNDQFHLHYQVQMSTQDETVVGAEALIRWIAPDGSVRSPEQWIRYAERTALIHDIGGWVLACACLQMRAWDDAGFRIPRIGVNIAARQLEDDTFYDRVLEALQGAGLAPQRLELEVTESQLMASPEQGIAVLRRLSQLGVMIAVDDFGTGYSSFSQLRQLPISVLKIDRSLVVDVDTSAEAGAVLQAIVQMAHALRFTVVAEGVERPAEQTALATFGCDAVQGYFIGMPMPGEAFAHAYAARLLSSRPSHLQVVPSKA